MIYVTGDLHGEKDRFSQKNMKVLKKNDTLIVCGDFGFLWRGGQEEEKVLKWIGKRPYQVLFVEGTHDNFDLLEKYPTVEFAGGKARQISGKCHQLLRGEIYRLEEQTVFTFGGGESTDMDMRSEGENWWPQELPSQEEIAHARENLQKHNNTVDYIITHAPSGKLREFMEMDSMQIDCLEAYLNQVSETVKFKQWFFGKCHQDKVIPPLHRCVFQDVAPIF